MAKLTTYTQNQKIECLKLYLITGNLTAVCATLKIPYETARQWKYSKWWEDMALEIKSEGRIELSAKLRKVAEKALGETLDRLESGDWVVSPTGEMVRRPVSAAVAAKIATDFLDKQDKLDREQTETNIQSVKDRLDMIAKSLSDMSRKTRRIEVIDAEDIGTTDSTIEGSWREGSQGTSLQVIEQDGPYEGEQADVEGREAECNDPR